MNTNKNPEMIWKFSFPSILAFVGAAVLIAVIYEDAVRELLRIWEVKEEYSYGYMIPFVTAFLIWQRKDILQRLEFCGSWMGGLVAIFGFALYLIGELSTLYLVVQYSLVIMVFGLALAVMGWQAFKVILVPLCFLVFMIPLPQFFLSEISQSLQLISSEIGVAFIRLFDISVYLEGNVIDLGVYKLQVVEACNGLRYLFPLMALGFIVAYFFNGAMWKKAVLFLSTIPITVLMNSIRIGAIGVMVEYWGIDMAEGFLHDFEGWVIFMACLGVLFVEMWILVRLGPGKMPLKVAFGIDYPEPPPDDVRKESRKLPMPYYPVLAVLALAAVTSRLLPDRVELYPERKIFAEFPINIDNWHGRTNTLESIYLDELKLDDYFLANYSDGESTVNLYIAYYASQRKGQSAHSPRTCIPGGGWKIQDISTVELDMNPGSGLSVNRVLIQKGDYTQLVYYWFQGRGRVVTNEYLVKWLISWDSIRIHRSDGGLVRLTAFIGKGQDIARIEQKLKSFARSAVPLLDPYIPE